MVGTIELDPDGRNLQIRFPYRPDLVEEVKTIPGRRWDRSGKMWRVPAGQIENVVALLMRHGFQMAPEVSSLLAGTHGTLPMPELEPATGDDAAKGGGKEQAPDSLSISSLNEQVRKAIHTEFPRSIWVVGEIADYDKNKDRQHVFFTLLEKRGENIEAQVSVAMFERTARMLRTRLETMVEPMTLADGIEIRALVKIDLYPKSGRYQLIIDDIDSTFTLGKLALSREEILRELRDKMLDDKNLAKRLPVPSMRIGVLTSHGSDGYHDFVREIEGSGIGFAITAYDVRVQGELLKPSMLQGLRYFAERKDEFDAVCIIRGGGSRTDLAWFDNRDVAFAVARHPLKILCGIGHQRDQSVLDTIAHSEKTPTATAAYLIEQVRHTREVLADLSRCLVESVRRMLRAFEQQLAGFAHALRHRVQGALIFERERLETAAGRLNRGSRHRLQATRDALLRRQERLRSGARRALDRSHSFLDTQAARQRLLDPSSVLKRGYTLARSPSGGILKGIEGLSPGQEIDVQFRDGRARTRIQDITKSKPSD